MPLIHAFEICLLIMVEMRMPQAGFRNILNRAGASAQPPPTPSGRNAGGQPYEPGIDADNNAVEIGMPVERVAHKMCNDGDERGLIVYGYKIRPTNLAPQ